MSGLRMILGPTALLATESAVFVMRRSAMTQWPARVAGRGREQCDAWRGRSGWEQFARIGFQTGEQAGA